MNRRRWGLLDELMSEVRWWLIRRRLLNGTDAAEAVQSWSG